MDFTEARSRAQQASQRAQERRRIVVENDPDSRSETMIERFEREHPGEMAKARAALEREADSMVEGGKYELLQHRTWSDEYPDDITVSVQVGDDDGRAMVVVTAGAVWLSDDQVGEVIDYLTECRRVAHEKNRQHSYEHLTHLGSVGYVEPLDDPLLDKN